MSDTIKSTSKKKTVCRGSHKVKDGHKPHQLQLVIEDKDN